MVTADRFTAIVKTKILLQDAALRVPGVRDFLLFTIAFWQKPKKSKSVLDF